MVWRKSLPIIDCSNIHQNLDDFAHKLGRAIEHFGFVYLVNHGFDPDVIESLNYKTEKFFNLPEDVRMKYKLDQPFINFFGYTPPGTERAGDTDQDTVKKHKDSKQTFDFSSSNADDASKFPIEIPGFKDALDAFRRPVPYLAQNILRAFAIYLKLDPEIFVPLHTFDYKKGCYSKIRSIYYPPEEDEVANENLRLGEHKDLGTFTFLFQDDQGGLEAQRKDGVWIPVPPIEGSIVLNTGQILESWSGGKFEAVMHRVRTLNTNIKNKRQSLIFFVLPDTHVPLVPRVQCQPGWIPPFIKPDETTEEFILRRFGGTRFYEPVKSEKYRKFMKA